MTTRYRRALAAAEGLRREHVKKSKSGLFPGITPGAEPVENIFTRQWLEREAAALPSGIYAFDVDGFDCPGPDGLTGAEWLRDEAGKEPWCTAAWVTASGNGVALFAAGRKAAGDSHAELGMDYNRRWAAVRGDVVLPFLDRFDAVLDGAPSNIVSLRFLVHDPGAVFNPEAGI